MKYVPPLGATDPNASYQDGNPEAGILGSIVPAAAIERPQREIMHVITQAGLEPSGEMLTQLYNAITKIIGSEVPLASDVVAGLIKVGTGLAISEDGVLSVPVSAGLEALRKSWIGVPRPWRSTTLPAGYAWANGSFVLFEDYPELEEVYNSGGFEGMLLPWDADEETIASHLGFFRPDAAQPTGLFLPSLGGQFSRAWVPGGAKDAGAWGRDEIQNITGHVGVVAHGGGDGAFYGTHYTASRKIGRAHV